MKEIPSLLRALSLSEMAKRSDELTVQAGSEGWSHEQYLRVLCELELDRRTQRRTERLLKEARLPDGKTMATLDQERLPLKLRRAVAVAVRGTVCQRCGEYPGLRPSRPRQDASALRPCT